MNIRRSALHLFALASLAATVALAVTGTPGPVTQSWATVLDDGGLRDTAKVVQLDPEGAVIVGGESRDLLGTSLRLAKIDSSGAVIWSKRFGSDDGPLSPDGPDRLRALVQLEPSLPNDLMLIGLAVDGAGDILVVCFDRNSQAAITMKVSGTGTELWRATYDTPLVDVPVGIEVDAAGRSFVGGTSSSRESVNAFIVSYDTNGGLIWQDEYGSGNARETIYDIARDPVGGSVYLAGRLRAQGNAESPLLLRYDSDGRLRWAKNYQEKPKPLLGYAQKVAVGPDGSVALAGWVSSGDVDIQVIKVDASSGKDLWSAVSSPASHDTLHHLAIDGSGNILVSGIAENIPETHPAFLNGLLLRYAPSGSLSWVASDERVTTYPGALAVDASGSAVVASVGNARIGDLFRRFWLTTRYDATGQQVWTAEYDGNPGGVANGYPDDVAVTTTGDTIVVGTVNDDIHVVSYRQP